MTKRTIILAGFVLLKFFLQYSLISPEYDLQRDEYLHLDQANHLAWGYLSVPPVTSWISLVIRFLGNGVFWIKFFPALFGALTMVVVWKAIEALNGNLMALVLGACCVLFSVLLRLNTLYQPNSLDVLCWTAFYFTVLRYVQTENRKWLFAAALVFALGFLNKYNIVFLLAGLFPALLLTPQRRLLGNKDVYLAAGLALVLILPNLAWQYNNGFPVVHHLKELADTQLVNADRWAFMKAQVLFFLGAVVVILSAFYALLFYPPFKSFRFFFWSVIFTLAVFLYLKAKDYYAIGLYPVYIAFGSVFLVNRLQYGWKRHLVPVLVALPLLSFIPMYQLAFPNKSPVFIQEHPERYKDMGLLRWEDGKDHALPQDFADMLGWKELAAKVDKAYASLPSPENTLVLCDNYGQAGAINYYTSKKIRAVSFSADYINWINLGQPYVHLIRVKNGTDRDGELAETGPYFQSGRVSDSVANPFSREYGTTIFIFTGAKTDIRKRIQAEIDEIKKTY